MSEDLHSAYYGAKFKKIMTFLWLVMMIKKIAFEKENNIEVVHQTSDVFICLLMFTPHKYNSSLDLLLGLPHVLLLLLLPYVLLEVCCSATDNFARLDQISS